MRGQYDAVSADESDGSADNNNPALASNSFQSTFRTSKQTIFCPSRR